MSLATARAAVYSLLTTCGPFATAEVSACDYRILEEMSASCIIFQPHGDSTMELMTFAGNSPRGTVANVWQFRGQGLIRWTGNAPCLIGQVYQMMDDIQQTFAKSGKGVGSDTASLLHLSRISANIDEMYDLGGHECAMVQFYFQEEEFDS